MSKNNEFELKTLELAAKQKSNERVWFQNKFQSSTFEIQPSMLIELGFGD